MFVLLGAVSSGCVRYPGIEVGSIPKLTSGKDESSRSFSIMANQLEEREVGQSRERSKPISVVERSVRN